MYSCEFPDCEYTTGLRSQIHYHHIVPKECGGSDSISNRIWLCPNCHSKVWIDDAKHGIHTQHIKGSIEIDGWFVSTRGKVLSYKEIE